jgi:hypothetical protein
VYVAWVEQDRNFDMTVRVLRLRSDGRLAKGWPGEGVRVASECPWAAYPAVVSLGNGVAVAWIEARNGVGRVRLAGLDAEGRPRRRWPADGLTLGESGRYGDAVELAGDDRGVFVAWTEMGERLSDVRVAYVPELDPHARAWTVVSRAVPPDATQLERHHEIVADGRGGAIVVWTDERSQETRVAKDLMDVFAQRISTSGEDAWTPSNLGNHAIAAGSWYQLDPHLVSDGKGGAFFSWNLQGPGMTASGRLRHVDPRGGATPGWPAEGVALGLEVSNLIPDLTGGVFATWADSTGAYLQRIDAGHPAGESAFFLGPTGEKTNVRLGGDGRGGAFMAWEVRKGAVSSRGAPGNVEVRIQHVVPGSSVSRIVTLPGGAAPPPPAFALRPVVPNPARSRCQISFDLPRPTRVTIDVFDVAGRRVARLADGPFEAGAHSLSWNLEDGQGRGVAAGLYLVRVVAGKNQDVARVTITR